MKAGDCEVVDKHLDLRARTGAVVKLIEKVGAPTHFLKLNKDGSPAHPLFLKGDLKPVPQ